VVYAYGGSRVGAFAGWIYAKAGSTIITNPTIKSYSLVPDRGSFVYGDLNSEVWDLDRDAWWERGSMDW